MRIIALVVHHSQGEIVFSSIQKSFQFAQYADLKQQYEIKRRTEKDHRMSSEKGRYKRKQHDIQKRYRNYSRAKLESRPSHAAISSWYWPLPGHLYISLAPMPPLSSPILTIVRGWYLPTGGTKSELGACSVHISALYAHATRPYLILRPWYRPFSSSDHNFIPWSSRITFL